MRTVPTGWPRSGKNGRRIGRRVSRAARRDRSTLGRQRRARCAVRCKGRGVAHVAGAIGRVCRVNHGSDVPQRNAPRVQVGVDVVGNLLWRPVPSAVVADEVGLPDECLFRLGGQVRPTARSFARYGSSSGLAAVAIAALLTRAAPAIMGMASLASRRGEGIRFPSFLLGVR
jgi:hypothetical protein